ncbi:hypothetical protein CIW83_09760 [Tissierella sp. P1]|uniref:hypothetical protein n=1 Tax=Tissierella sp. P1 TaxID=1280483 RepID=UPI000BA08F35|nr:hypothetical protein [Tissierella sp. P1]OZV12371.1 hypothetical protein CIW83_09760 [Tissierella sp. P1]
MDRPRKIHNKRLPKNYYNYFDICKMEGIPDTRAKNAVSEKKVEGIKYLEELTPIEHLFEVFEKPIKGGMVNQYGILRRHYDYWKENGEVPKISPGRPKKHTDDNLVNVNIRNFPKDLYEEFKTIVDNANSMSVMKVGYHDMIAVAVKEFVDRRPNFK